MSNFITMDLLFRWLHVAFGITWIGLLYYFNFIQGEYFKEADPMAKADATKKLAPRALWWFRWGAMLTFLTGLVMLELIRLGSGGHGWNGYIAMGALMGTLMFLNVWLIIWPNQKIVCGIVQGDATQAAPKALLASRTNTLFSLPMLLGMMGSFHGIGHASYLITQSISVGLWIVLALIVVLEINAIVGKLGPLASVTGVVTSSVALTAIFLALMQWL